MRWLLLLVGLAGCARLEPTTAASTAPLRVEGHRLVLLELRETGLSLLSVTEVAAPLPRLKVPEPSPWQVTLRDADGVERFSEPVPPGNTWRAEFVGERAVHLLMPRAAFTVRVPSVAGTLTLTAERRSLAPASDSAERVVVGSVVLP